MLTISTTARQRQHLQKTIGACYAGNSIQGKLSIMEEVHAHAEEDAALLILEQNIIAMEEEMHAIELAMARIGARLMGVLDDGLDIDDNNDEIHWEAVTVNLDDYRWMGDPSFQRHFRLTKPSYEALLRELAIYLIDRGIVQRIRNELAVPLLMVLWILANPDTFRSVALRFGCKPGDVHFHYQYIIRAFRNMAPQYIKWPDAQERAAIEARFFNYSGFRGIVGVIDGTYQVVTAPVVHAERYVNRHHQYSFNTMVVADDNLLIRSLYIGEVGAMHDARVFRRSPLFRQLLQDNNEEILSADQHLIGDSAYRIMDFLMVPFRNVGNLTPEQIEFNRRLSRCRMRIEHTFGKAFGQWRRMKMLHSYNINLAIDHFTSCYMLHNFMILNGEEMMNLDHPDPFIGHWEEPAENQGNFDNQDDILGLGEEAVRLEADANMRGIERRLELLYEIDI